MFGLRSFEREYLFSASSLKEMNEWIEAVRSCIISNPNAIVAVDGSANGVSFRSKEGGTNDVSPLYEKDNHSFAMPRPSFKGMNQIGGNVAKKMGGFMATLKKNTFEKVNSVGALRVQDVDGEGNQS